MNILSGKSGKESKNQVIVTGASGFIGRHLVKKLLDSEFDVIALVRDLEKSNSINLLNNAKHVYFDIKSSDHKLNISKDSILIHCAWEDIDDVLSLKHLEDYEYHFKFLKKIIESGVKKIIVTGSVSEYGIQYGPVSPNQITKPNTPYAFAKDTLHKSLRLLQSRADFGLIWARLFYTFGDGQNEKCLIPQFDAAIERGEKVFNMSLGEQLLDYLPVEDVAEAILNLIVEEDNGTFNVCSRKPISLRRLLELRMREKGKLIDLNLGYYEYRQYDSIAIWGGEK